MSKLPSKYTTDTMSVKDIIDTYNNYDTSEEAKEPILYFISELTGLSIDTLLQYVK